MNGEKAQRNTNSNELRECVHAVHSDNQITLDPAKDSPYTTTYNADYSTQSYRRNPNIPPSSSILRKDAGKKVDMLRDKASANKTVKFDEKVVISDGYQTSSVLVNDLKEKQDALETRHRPHTSYNFRPDRGVSKIVRPATPPENEHGSLVRLARPTASVQKELMYSKLNEQPVQPYQGGMRLSDQLFQLQKSFNRSAVHRKFHLEFPENAPDIRRKPDTRITTNERRHIIPEVGCHSYYFHG